MFSFHLVSLKTESLIEKCDGKFGLKCKNLEPGNLNIEQLMNLGSCVNLKILRVCNLVRVINIPKLKD